MGERECVSAHITDALPRAACRFMRFQSANPPRAPVLAAEAGVLPWPSGWSTRAAGAGRASPTLGCAGDVQLAQTDELSQPPPSQLAHGLCCWQLGRQAVTRRCMRQATVGPLKAALRALEWPAACLHMQQLLEAMVWWVWQVLAMSSESHAPAAPTPLSPQAPAAAMPHDGQPAAPCAGHHEAWRGTKGRAAALSPGPALKACHTR